MRKIIQLSLVILFICYSYSVLAQESKSLWLDAKAGLNASFILNQNAYGNGELDYATTFGFAAGPGVNYFITDNWGLSTSLVWAKIGQNYSGRQSGGDATRKVKLNYIEMPLLAMRRIEGTKVPTWIAFGPELLFLTGAKQVYHREDGNPLPNESAMHEGNTRISNHFKPVDLALDISLSKLYDVYENSKLRLLVSANMAIGLTDMNSKDWQIPNLKNKYAGSHNFYIGIKVGLMYKAWVNEE
jgi:hypothetical protein